MTVTIPRLTADESKFLTKVTTLGSATALPVAMGPSEFAKLIGVIYYDTQSFAELEETHPGLGRKINPGVDYYSIPEGWFEEPIQLDAQEHISLMQKAKVDIQDFVTYLRCLAELHKRRKKYSMILSAQPMPTMVQVSPRSLMEYGHINPEALASWLTWRKFFYDLDNRSAQETGYLFEPILAAAIGGEPQGSRAKVVKRADDPSKGRQVDCYKAIPGQTPLAYEFKLRVTIAASGQGRIGEEHQFAVDCKASGAIPVLVILDPTPNPTMAGLKAVYEDNGGHAYIGDEAWQHLEEEAGPVMARFIEKYVRAPLTEISAFEQAINGDPAKRKIQLLDLGARVIEGKLQITLGTHARLIPRKEDPSLVDASEDKEE
jgi:hypothetical protein